MLLFQVPVFDMANHAPSSLSTAALVVHFKRRDASLYAQQQHGSAGEGSGAHALPGVGVELSLVAVRRLEAGQEITFSYNPDDDEHPLCNERWTFPYLKEAMGQENCPNGLQRFV